MISIVIPTYKNKSAVFKKLKYNLKYFKSHEIIIVNDDPEESIETDIASLKKTNIILIENDKNLGFAQTVNKGVDRASNSLVVLFNNDVLLNDSSFEKAVKLFESNNNLFAVGFAEKEKDGSIMGKNKIFWRKGFFYHTKADDINPGIIAWAQGGACMIDKSKFENLGKFDPLYSPFYWEDIDLSYKAWKAGYEVWFEPSILVEHHHESTINKYFDKNQVKSIAYRNQFIFMWKNIDDLLLCFSHAVFLIPQLVLFTLKGEFMLVKGVFQAFLLLPTIMRQKMSLQKIAKITDSSILAKFKN